MCDNAGMKAIILAGGFATRLRPLTDELPKSLLPLGGGVVIDEQVKQLFLAQAIEHLYIVTNAKFYDLLEAWRQRSSLVGRITVVNNGVQREADRLGAIGDLKYVLDQTALNEDILILGSDNLFDTAFDGIINFYKQLSPATVVVAVNKTQHSNLSKQSSEVVFNEAGRIIHFEEKPLQPQSPYFSSMLYIVPKTKLNLVRNHLLVTGYTDNAGDFIAWLVSNNHQVMAYQMAGKRFDIGDHESYRATQAIYQSK